VFVFITFERNKRAAGSQSFKKPLTLWNSFRFLVLHKS
jgi:hypothetical protein